MDGNGETMKVKFGTQLDDSVFEQLKLTSAREHRAIGIIVQNALTQYMNQGRQGHARKNAFDRLLERDPLNITKEQFRESMEEDFFDQ